MMQRFNARLHSLASTITARMLPGMRWAAPLRVAALLPCLLWSGDALAQPANLAERARQSIVYIYFDVTDPETGKKARGQGTGFVVSPFGHVLTAAHLFTSWRRQTDASKAANKIWATRQDKPGFITESPLILSPINLGDGDAEDVALLKLPHFGTYETAPICLTAGDGIKIGDSFTAFGFPLDQNFQPIPGVFGTQNAAGGRWAGTSAFTEGMSGGPIYANGTVVGLVKGGLTNTEAVRFITPIRLASSRLAAAGAPDRCAPAAPSADPPAPTPGPDQPSVLPPIAAAPSAPVKLFLGVSHKQLEVSPNQLDSSADAKVRAFIAVQKLMETIKTLNRLPEKVQLSARLGDVASWETADDRRKLEKLGVTHYLIAEPFTVAKTKAIAIKWHVGTFSSDSDQALDGWLTHRSNEPEIFIPNQTERGPNQPVYEDVEFKEKTSGARDKTEWETKTPESVAGDLIKILQHIFPEMRRANKYFVDCIDYIPPPPKVDPLTFMALLSDNLKTAGWISTFPLRPLHAQAICTDIDDKNKVRSTYLIEDANFLISGYLSMKAGRVNPKIRVEDRTTRKRKDYVTRAKDLPDSEESLGDFCTPELFEDNALKRLVDYIHARGFKVAPSFSLGGNWKC